jgi:uncharacterized protein YjdB
MRHALRLGHTLLALGVTAVALDACHGATEVQRGAVGSVVVKPSSATIQVDHSVALDATVMDADGKPLDGRQIFWASSDSTVAAVNESGIVTGRKLGTVQIAASAEGKFGLANVEVSPPPVARVAISPPSVTLNPGETSALAASAFDDSGAPITGRTVTWASGNTNVATVDAGGTVTAQGSGTADVTATIGGVVGHASVTVLAAPAPVASVTISPKQVTIQSGQTTHLTATVRDKDGHELKGRTVTWTTTNQLVVNVDGNGNITGFFPGSATIVATCERITGTASVRVR